MNYKLNSFLYICKARHCKKKEGKVKKFVPEKQKDSNCVTVKYIECDSREKCYVKKKDWSVDYILNRTKKQKKEIENTEKNESPSQKKEEEECSKSYQSLLKKLMKNIQNYESSTVINTGVESVRKEKNVFLYGSIFKKYLKQNSSSRNDTSKWNKNTVQPTKDTFQRKKKYEEIKCDTEENTQSKTSNASKKKKGKSEKKKGLIYDLYNCIGSINDTEVRCYLSSWMYINDEIIDLIGKRKQRRSERISFCHKCYLHNCLDKKKRNNEENCKRYPFKRKIKNEKKFINTFLYLLKAYAKSVDEVLDSRKNNLCIICRIKVVLKNRPVYIFFVNFPVCSLENNQYFLNSNNEKSLLFIFHKKIINQMNSLRDYSNLIFLPHASSHCHSVLNIKKKLLQFLKKSNFSIQNQLHISKELENEIEYYKGSNICNRDMEKKNRQEKETEVHDLLRNKVSNSDCSFNKLYDKSGYTFITTTYNKKEIMFHIHMFELLSRLLFKNTKSYITMFILEKVNDENAYQNMFYLNLLHMMDIPIHLRKGKKFGNKKKYISNEITKEKTQLVKQQFSDSYEVELQSKNELILDIENQLKKKENQIEEQEKTIQRIEKQLNEKKDCIIQYEQEIVNFKKDLQEKMKLIEQYKNKCSKLTSLKNENTEEPSPKSSIYVKKLYNENTLLKQKLKKLNSEMKKDTNESLIPEKNSFSRKIVKNPSENEKTNEEQLNFFSVAFKETEKKLYIADMVIKVQKNIIEKIKKEKIEYLEELKMKQIHFKKEIKQSFDFIYSICEDIPSKKEKICLANRLGNLEKCIKNYCNDIERNVESINNKESS